MSISEEIKLLPVTGTRHSVNESDASHHKDHVEVIVDFDTHEDALVDLSSICKNQFIKEMRYR